MIYAVGDVHGEAEALREVLQKASVQPSDLVIFLGDIINRGPDGYGCVEQVLQFDRCRKVFIHGNHEESMLSFLEDGAIDALEGMGGAGTIESYAAAGYPLVPGDPSCLPPSHLRFYAQAEPWTLPFYITDTYIFTHAGWDLARPVHLQSLGVLRWGRVKGFEESIWSQTVVRGHTPTPKVTFSRAKQTIHLDTGCGFGGFLSAIALPSEQTFSARPASFKPKWFAELKRR